MASKAAAEPDLGELVRELLHNSEHLIDLQLQLLRSEIGQELRKAGTSALALGAGAGLLAASGLLSSQMAFHLLRRVTGLPEWACYGLAAGTLGAAGVGLLKYGRNALGDVQLPALPQSSAALKENLAWLKEQATSATKA